MADSVICPIGKEDHVSERAALLEIKHKIGRFLYETASAVVPADVDEAAHFAKQKTAPNAWVPNLFIVLNWKKDKE